MVRDEMVAVEVSRERVALFECAGLGVERREQVRAAGRGRWGHGGGPREGHGLLDGLEASQRLRGETGEADALTHELWTLSHLLPGVWRRATQAYFICVVDKVTACAIGAEADGVKGTTRLRLVLWMSVEAPHLIHAMSELTFGPVLAGAILFVCAAQLGLITRRDGRSWGLGRGQRAGAYAQAWWGHETCGCGQLWW